MSHQFLLEFRRLNILSEELLIELFMTFWVQVILAQLWKREFEGYLVDQLLKFWKSFNLWEANILGEKGPELLY
jgi:hypothetical protein